jgi:bifunctional non-homologous end joining protein LigD
MLATLGTAVDIDESTDHWAFEMKWDGIRALATIAQGAVRFATRNGIDVTATYPDLQDLAGDVTGSAVLDGEIVALNKQGRPDFGLLQRRMKLERAAEVRAAVSSIPVRYVVFDILSLRGRSVVDDTYDERRRMLRESVRTSGVILVPDAFEGDLEAAIDTSRRLGLEGVMAKRRDSSYALGRRSRAWIKLKHHASQEVVIGGWRPGTGHRANSIGSLLMGVPAAQGLAYVGRVGTGFGDDELAELATRLTKLERKTSPFADAPPDVARDANWITPSLVGEVEFAEWTSAGRLRQPSWRGWRPDKSPADVVRETTEGAEGSPPGA